MGIWERAVALNNERNLEDKKGNQKETTILFAGKYRGREGVQGRHEPNKMVSKPSYSQMSI